MKFKQKQSAVVVAGVVLCLSQGAFASQQGEQDSAYRWGRWAVLSPAAGGVEPYVQAAAPGAQFNARPGDASEFDPNVTLNEPTPPAGPPVVVPNPPGEPPPPGDPRNLPPVVVPNPPGANVPGGDPRMPPLVVQQPPVVVAN